MIDSWSGWDGLPVGADHHFVWFDSLNRLYITAERWDELHGNPQNTVEPGGLWAKSRGNLERPMIEQAQADVLAAMRAAKVAGKLTLAPHAQLTAAEAEQVASCRLVPRCDRVSIARVAVIYRKDSLDGCKIFLAGGGTITFS